MLWRDKQIEYTRLVTTSNGGAHYRPFWELTRAGLRYACKRLALDLTTEREERLMNQYRHLSAFPENQEVLGALKGRGVRHRHPDQRRPGDARHRRSQRRPRRPARPRAQRRRRAQVQDPPDAYALGPQATRPATPSRSSSVSCNGWDALGATWFGYRTLWVNRYQLPFEELGTQPTRTGTSLRDVLAFF